MGNSAGQWFSSFKAMMYSENKPDKPATAVFWLLANQNVTHSEPSYNQITL